MKKASDVFNDLPIEQRMMLGEMLLEAEIRFVRGELMRIAISHKKLMKQHHERLKRLEQEIKSRQQKRTEQPA